jgi:hypothetical protein
VTVCPICGRGVLKKKRGTFEFEPPSNVPGDLMMFKRAEWEECVGGCKEQIIGHALYMRLEKETKKRRESEV